MDILARMMVVYADPAVAAAAAGLVGAGLGVPLARAARHLLKTEPATGWRTDAAAVLACASLLVVCWAAVGLRPELPAYLTLAVGCVVLGVVDIVEKRLPDVVVLPLTAAVFALLLPAAALRGDWSAAGAAALGGIAMFAVYFLLAVVSPAGIGMGDVKLAAVLGIATAYLGWRSWVVCLVAGFLIGAAVAIIGLVTRRVKLRSSVPFGPSMIAGAFLALAIG